ncbi:MAG: hypothetical protein Fur0018_09880 [Anaerolineales bacterium]
MNRLLKNYPQEVEKILAKYPPAQKRSAVMPLLYLAQREKMYLNRQDLLDVAAICGITETQVEAIVGFYTLYHEQQAGKHRVQVCTDMPCALRGADDFYAHLCERLGIEDGGTTPDGAVTVEQVMCLAACHNAPMFQVQNADGLTYHENQTVESALEIIEKLRQEAAA